MKNEQVIPLEGVFFRLGHLGRGPHDASHRMGAADGLETTWERARPIGSDAARAVGRGTRLCGQDDGGIQQR